MLHGEPATKGTPRPAGATPRRRVAELLRRGGVQQRVLKQVRVQSHAEERAAAMQRPGGVGVRVGVCWRPERREWNGRRGARRGAWHERVQADVPRAVQGSCTRLRPRSTAILCQLEGLAPGDQPRTQLTA